MRKSLGAPLAPLTTLHLGGPARELVTCESAAEIVEVERAATASKTPLFVLGGGSNVVVADRGFDGAVLQVASRGIASSVDGGRARWVAEAGEPWDELVARAADEGLAGVECLAGIPGKVGATPMQNVGAYGQDVAQVITRVEALDRETGAARWLSREECRFGYRTSALKHARLPSGELRWVVLRVEIELARSAESAPIAYAELASALGVPVGGRAPVALVRDTVVRLRRGKGMVLDPADPESVSAGSFFTNPILGPAELAALEARVRERLGPDAKAPTFADPAGAKVAAAWLIERAGFTKGWSPTGGVGISRKHALALVRRDGGTTTELLEVARRIEEGVHAAFGVRLEREPVLIGQGIRCPPSVAPDP